MKSLPQTILIEQVNPTPTAAVKVEIQSYDFPADVHSISYKQFDANAVYQNASTTGARACCASDGSLIYFNGTTITRFATPSPTTDFSSLGATGTPTFHNAGAFDIAANPTSGEVIAFRTTSSTHIELNTSTNYGVTWGGWTWSFTSAYAANFVRASFNSSGDIMLLVNAPASASYSYQPVFRRRISGTWIPSGTTVWTNCYFVPDISESGFFSLRWAAKGQNPDGSWWYSSYSGNVYLRNAEVCYDGSWFILGTLYQDNSGDGSIYYDGTGPLSYRVGMYFGTITNAGSYTYGGQCNITDSKMAITSLTQISNMGMSTSQMGQLPPDLQGRLRDSIYINTATPYNGGSIAMNQEQTLIEVVYPYAYIIKLSNGKPPIVSFHDNGKNHFISMREDLPLTNGVFGDAIAFTMDFPVNLCANTDYIFAYNGNQIFICPMWYDWAIPTVGTGAGSKLALTTSRIQRIQENVQPNSDTLDIVCNNSDNYFNSPGVGALVVLEKGSRINLYLGFNIGGVDTTNEYTRYFVDNWEYTREPNLSQFILHCTGAWGLLQDYKFPRNVSFNYLGATTTYNIYQLIEMMVKAIGGTLTYINRSTSMTTIYPKIDIQAGYNAAELLIRLLGLVLDQIKFFGNDATIIYPQSTDSPIYYYTFPS